MFGSKPWDRPGSESEIPWQNAWAMHFWPIRASPAQGVHSVRHKFGASMIGDGYTKSRRRRRGEHHRPGRDRVALRGIRSRGASTGSDALKAAAAFRPDLMVLDIHAPRPRRASRSCSGSGPTGTTYRRVPDRPRLTEEKVKGLTVGGDDYVTKPFSLEELVARVRAVLRRTGAINGDGTARLVFADLELDDDTHEVWRGRTRIELTPTSTNSCAT